MGETQISLDKLSKAKRALLEKRLQKARVKGAQAATIGRRPPLQASPLSFAQQRLWFLNQWEPDSPIYNIPIALRLTGQLDEDALCETLDEIVRRHEVLRTIYVSVDNNPVQELAPDSEFVLDVIDLRSLQANEREAESKRLADEEARRLFRLDCELPIRATLLRLSDTEHIVLLTLHHIVADGWSLGLLLKELKTLYADFHAGRPASLLELPIQYADFAYWQRNWLQGETLEKQLAYWEKQLVGAPAVLDLPTDRSRPPIRTYNGAVYDFHLPSSLPQSVRDLSTQEGVSPFVTLLAAFQALLWRYTGQSDIVVGAPIAGRNRSEIENLIGCFVNTLVLRADFSGDLTMRELLRQVREVTLGAYAHQDLPFEKLVETLQPERLLNYSPLFQVVLNFHNTPPFTLELPGLRVSYQEVHNRTAKFDLSLAIQDTGEEMRCAVTYSTDLFESDTISRMMEHFLVLLAGFVTDPDQRLAKVPLLTLGEQQALIEWNQTTVAYSPLMCVHQLFEEHVERTPDAIAAVFEQERCTYRALNRRANQLAHYLRRLGVGPDVRVGLYVERSLDIIVGILGILKAGGAYVPIDPIYPPERVQFMLGDIAPSVSAEASVLLTQAHLAAGLPEMADVHVVCLDSDWERVVECDDGNLSLDILPSNLMYVLFTSGSTGWPKGVAVEHRNYVNYLQGVLQWLDVSPGSSFAIVSTFAADLGTTMTFGSICSGGQLHIIAYQRAADPELLADYFCRNPIDVLKLAPSHFEAMQTLSNLADVVPRQHLILAGEACPWELVAQVQALALDCDIQNHYGPTETAVAALVYQLPQSLPESTVDIVPLGRPLGNVCVHILDRHGLPVPVGVPGELYIGGKGVTRGYLNRPKLTAERFVPDPFSRDAGARLYRTGDLARYRPDGSIAFLGRVDSQVKLRGFRVELGEIESTLEQCPDVREAVVVLQDVGKDKWLTAYVVPQDGRALTGSALRAFLSGRLPDYMIPTMFLTLDALPLTPNGKVDRRALPEPEDTGIMRIAGTFVAPRDYLELQLIHIWEEVLGVHPVGVNHNFFELGGHSLSAIRLKVRIQQDFGQHLPLTALFQAPTVGGLASVLRQRAERTASSFSLVPMQTGASHKRPLFFVHPGSGSVFCYTHLIRHLGPDQPFYGLQAPGLEDGQEPLTQTEVMADYYISLLRTVQPEGPYLLGGWCWGGGIAFEMAQQLQAQGQEIKLLALLDGLRPGMQESESDEAALAVRFMLAIGLPLEAVCPEPLDHDTLVAYVHEHFGRLHLDAGLADIMERGKRANILPDDMILPQIQQRFRVFRGVVQAVESYVPRVYSGAITLFKAAEAFKGRVVAGDMGWGALAARGITVHIIPGNHYTLLREPQVQVLAEQLGHYLRKGE